MNDYQKFIAMSRYARWLEDQGRREDWDETVQRFINEVVKPKVNDPDVWQWLYSNIYDLRAMPSMRALMTAGPALNRDNTSAYNCSYLVIDDPRAFDEAMFIMLCGTGVGYSVERQYIDKMPTIPENMKYINETIIVEDSKEGWATAYRTLIEHLYKGEILMYDTSKVRPAGARLKTFGGRASGPAPLVELFDFTTAIFRKAAGRKLNSLEAHDIMCKIGEVVVVGGVRRSAMISLSDLSDQRMRTAKSGAWYENEKQRALANNSTAHTEKPDAEAFMREWLALIESKSGERGIFNRTAAQKQASKYGKRSAEIDYGTNTCSEIILRPYQFCNLSEVIARYEDDFDSIRDKVEAATILGTIQATYTDFPYLRDIWRKNTKEEALLGTSITGIMDSPWLRNATESDLRRLEEHAVRVNELWAKRLGINPAAAITCVKPSGTVSQLTDTASGIHARFAPYYIRTVRGDNKDPMTEFMKAAGIPNEPDIMKPDNTTVFSFPMKAPEGAVTRNDRTAIEQLEFWLKFQRGWCHHKPSVTINVRDKEWMEVGAFVYEHFDEMSGVSFLPHDDHVYQQAPYQEITEDQYNELLSKMPKDIDWAQLSYFESSDHTSGSQTLACASGVCEIVDIN